MVKENVPPTKRSRDPRTHLLGLGLDHSDGHLRITRGENFHLVGGSRETHEHMQEQAVKINEKLADRGKNLDNVSREEFVDLAREVGMKIIPDDLPSH